MKRAAVVFSTVVLVFFSSAVMLLAQSATSGQIVGRVTDADGSGLPGVVVTASSASLQSSRMVLTRSDGEYRLSLLPPGQYRLEFRLDGFAPGERSVEVRLDQTVTVNQSLNITVVGSITVTSEAPTVDTTSTTLGTKLDRLSLETLPTARNYSAVVQITPGVASDAHPDNPDQSSITVYGSTGAENVFYIDGVNTTGAEYGFQGKELNFEFIEAVDVKTGGYEAEYGRSTGGIINVITKSGGNEFHGDVFGYLDNDSLQQSADPISSTAGTIDGFTRSDFGLGLGGYLVKDRLWFFAAYDRVANETDSALPAGPLAGQVVTSESDRDLAAGKLTWRFNESQSLVASYFQDPRDDSGAINDAQHTLNGEASTYLGVRSFGGEDLALRWEAIFGTDWLVSAQVSQHTEENSVGPATAAGDQIQVRNVDTNFFQTGGFGLIQQKDFERNAVGGSVTRFWGDHEIKGGLEYEEESADVVRRFSGGQQVDAFEVASGRTVFSHFYWTTLDATVGNAPVSQLVAAPEHKVTTLFVQDRWSVRSNFTLNVGLRWDRQEIIDAAGTKQIDLKDDYAPRLGFVWDPKSDGRSKLYGSFGRYYEQLPMDLVVRSFSFERQARIFNFSPTAVTPNAQAEDEIGRTSTIFGGFTEPSDPNLENQYINEFLLGYEREVAPDVAVGIKGIYRDYGQVIEDFLCRDDGTYCIGNPGQGIMRRIFSLDYSQTFPAPKAEREFKGVELSATKRFSNNWQGLASYLYSKLDGNFDGLFAPFTNIGPDPNITAAYDYFDFFTNGSDLSKITNTGPLSNDRRHQFKVSGLYLTPWKLQVGVSAYWKSGTPLTRYGYSDIYGRYEFFLGERGSEGRTPATYEADLHLGYPVTVGPADVNILLDVFNLLDAQRAILLDERWGFQEADNASPTPVNPNYKKPALRTPPRTLRVGVRVSF